MNHIRITNNDDLNVLVTVTDENNQPVLSGVELIQFAISDTSTSTDTLINKSYPASGISIVDLTAAQYLVEITDSDVSGLVGDYYFETRITIDDESQTVAEGTIRIKDSIF